MESTEAEKLIGELRGACEVALEVRKRQKEYFKTKDKEILIDAKRLEAALDMRLATLGYK